MQLNRREFLKAASAAGCLASFANISYIADGAEMRPGKPVLVVVFLRGGADGLHIVGPSNNSDYIAARPPELRVTDSGARAGITFEQRLDPASEFRFHPDAAPLADLYRAERLAILNAIGLKAGTRSHFVAQDMIERGLSDEKQLASTESGWLARSVTTIGGHISAFSANTSPVYALHGIKNVLSVPDISAGLGVPWGTATSEFLRSISLSGSSTVHRATLEALDILNVVDRGILRDDSGKIIQYRPSGQASYDGSGDLMRSLTSVVRLAKMDVGLSVACIDHGGWDTHEGQSGRMSSQLKQLSIGLTAFHEDMAASNHKVVILVMTEFGRRLRANKSGGTDHGHGGCWFVLGDGVRGGNMYGKWPGLSTQVLDQGVDLAVTTDYRAVLTETLFASDMPMKDSFPAWRPETPPLGIFANRHQ